MTKKDKWLLKTIRGKTGNREFILNFVRYEPKIIKYIDKDLIKDIDFVKQLVEINGFTLQYFPTDLRNDKELVVIALKHSDGFALKYASEELQADREVVKEAIKKWRAPLNYASKELQDEFNKIIDDYYKKHKV